MRIVRNGQTVKSKILGLFNTFYMILRGNFDSGVVIGKNTIFSAIPEGVICRDRVFIVIRMKF